MGRKSTLLLLLLLVVILVIIGEIIYFFFLQHRSEVVNKKTQQESTGAVTSLYPLGHYLPTIGNSAFTLVAQLKSVNLINNSISASIAYNLKNGLGQPVITTISISNYTVLIRRNDPILSPTSSHMRIYNLDKNKTLQELNHDINFPIAFLFLLKAPQPNLPAYILQTMGDVSCNNKFYSFLQNGANAPSCKPFTQQISVYTNAL